ncbi:recombinase family protein [Rhizobium leguminosarum]|uniref:Integrase-like protein y4lS n=2 Tax=Rhizobium leguminosarum TaxID=384 RepID=A0A2K9ZCT2_RHILE|nr:recombinase family protein [Rhizobium leguminosarum]AUW46052.1 Integrase-like protein y4lS [Rhizobium leguminosarum]
MLQNRMARIGYARVSTTDEDLDIQNERLKAAGCEIIRSETGSGASRKGRSELETIMQFLHAGDELVVLRLDRLGRSTRDVLNLVHELDEKGASLRILEPEVTTAGSMGRMVITILGMVADMELKFIKDRQRAGIDAAKADGIYTGRKKNVDDAEIRRRIAAGATKAAVARDLNISRMTVYRALEGQGSQSAST